nr:reverse transcriptase domain-containing protein [Tanacetum cinerariifolium]
MNTASSLGTGSLPSNSVPNPQEDLKVITTRSGVTLAGPLVSPPLSKEVNREPKTITYQVTLDYDSHMTEKYFVEYTGIEVKHFRDTLLQHMGNVKKSVFERARHQRQYDRRVNKRLIQTQESKIDMGKAVNDDLVVTKISRTESEVQDDNSRSGNDPDADDADIRPI